MRGAAWGLTAALLVAALVPIWAFPHAATQDGPSHLYNTHVLLHWDDPGSPYPAVYEKTLAPGPNWLGTATLYALMAVFEPLVAEKTLMTLYAAGMAAAWAWWLRGFSPSYAPLAALGPLLALTFFLFKGFYSFCLSVPLFLLAAGWARRHRAGLTPLSAATLNALLAAAWLGHIVSFGIGLISCAAILILGDPGRRAAWRRSLWLSPSLLLAAAAVASSGGESGRRWPAGRVVLYLLRGEWLVWEGGSQLVVSSAVMALLGWLALWSFAAARRRTSGTEPGDAARALLPAAAIAWILCFLLPRAVGEGDFLTDRLALYPVLLLAPLLPAPSSRSVRGGLAAAIVTLTAWQAAHAWRYQRRANAELEEYLAAGSVISPGSRVLPVMWRTPGQQRVTPLLHAGAHYAREAGAINLANYEALTRHFQIRLRRKEGPPLALVERDPSALDPRALEGVDFVIAWNMRQGAPPELTAAYAGAFDVAAESGRLIIYRRRESRVLQSAHPIRERDDDTGLAGPARRKGPWRTSSSQGPTAASGSSWSGSTSRTATGASTPAAVHPSAPRP